MIESKQFWTYLHIAQAWGTCKGILSDFAKIEPTYTVGP